MFDPRQVIFFYGLYLFCRVVFRNANKPDMAANYFVSMLNTYAFLVMGNYDVMISYYCYDLILMIMQPDVSMVVHHLGTIITLNAVRKYSDISLEQYYLLDLIVKSFKVSDLTYYWFRILKYVGCSNNMFYKLCVKSTIWLWSIFRVVVPIYLHISYRNTFELIDAIAVCLYANNIYGIYSMMGMLAKNKRDK